MSSKRPASQMLQWKPQQWHVAQVLSTHKWKCTTTWKEVWIQNVADMLSSFSLTLKMCVTPAVSLWEARCNIIARKIDDGCGVMTHPFMTRLWRESFLWFKSWLALRYGASVKMKTHFCGQLNLSRLVQQFHVTDGTKKLWQGSK